MKKIGFCIAIAVCLVAGVWGVTFLRGNRRTLDAHSVLHNGEKVDAELVFESAWPWIPATHFSALHVVIDGVEQAIPRQAYGGIGGINATQAPVIVEKAGYPEVLASGTNGEQIRWRFGKMGFWKRRIAKNGQWDVAYYAPPHTTSGGALNLIPANSGHFIEKGKKE